MVTLKDVSNNRWIGSISFTQLKFLNEELEKNALNDQDYRVDRLTLEKLKERAFDSAIINIIEKAMGDKDTVEFYWIKS